MNYKKWAFHTEIPTFAAEPKELQRAPDLYGLNFIAAFVKGIGRFRSLHIGHSCLAVTVGQPVILEQSKIHHAVRGVE